MHLRLGDGGVCAGERVLPEDREPGAGVQAQSEPSAGVSLDDRIREVESNLIGWALKASDGNKSKAAELLRVKRSTLGDRIKKLGLDHLETPATEPPPAGRR